MGSRGCFLVHCSQWGSGLAVPLLWPQGHLALSSVTSGNGWDRENIFLSPMPPHGRREEAGSAILFSHHQGWLTCIPDHRVSSSMLPREGEQLWKGVGPSFPGVGGELSPEGFGQCTCCSIRQEAGPVRGGAGSAQHSSNDPMLIWAMNITTDPGMDFSSSLGPDIQAPWPWWQHGPRWLARPWHLQSPWWQLEPDTTQDPSYHGATDPDMALCSGLWLDDTLGYPHGHRLQPRSRAFMWLLMSIQATDITDPWCGRTMDTDMVLGNSLSQDVTMVPDGSTGHPHQMALGHQYGPRWPQTPSMGMVFDCLRSHRHPHRPWLQQGHGHKHGPSWQP